MSPSILGLVETSQAVGWMVPGSADNDMRRLTTCLLFSESSADGTWDHKGKDAMRNTHNLSTLMVFQLDSTSWTCPLCCDLSFALKAVFFPAVDEILKCHP